MKTRFAVAAALIVMGSAAFIVGSFRPWYQDAGPGSVAVADLFTGMEHGEPEPALSMQVPLCVAAALALLGLLARSRIVLALGALTGLATCVLWTVQQALDTAPVAFELGDIQQGAANAAAGAVGLMLAMFLLPTKPRSPATHRPPRPAW